MNENAATGDTNTGQPTTILAVAPREEFIKTAVNFLQNEKIKRNALTKKQQFLRTKGLTDDEIQIACDRAGVFTTDPNNSTVISMGINTPNYVQPSGQSSTVLRTYHKIKEIVSSTALFGGIAYVVYLFYKNYIEPLLFGKKKRKKTLDEAVIEMNENVDKNIRELQQELGRVKEEIYKVATNDSVYRELTSFKTDLDAIKGLLLNRKQFSSPVVPPSIPVWQLQSQPHADTEIDKNYEAGSGSGSSETEVVTKHSDSSLELM